MTWRRTIGYTLLFVLLVGLLPVLGMAQEADTVAGTDKIDPEVLDEIAIKGQANFWIGMAVQADLSAAYDMDWESRGRYVYNTLTETASQTQAGAIAYLEAHNLDYESFWINNSLYVRGGDLTAVQDLAARGDVARIKADEVFYLPEPPEDEGGVEGTYDSWGLDWVNAPDVWAMGFDGTGIVVANIDTGVQYNHPQLNNTYRGTIDGTHQYNWCDPSDICAGDIPCDNNGHGTHTMGTISGENDDPGGDPNLIGMAPGSIWMACKGCESYYCSEYALGQCAQWIAAPTNVMSGDCGTTGTPNPSKRPHVVNNSWGGGGGDPWYQAYVQSWRAAGIFPAFSAGNSSTCGSIGSPGDYQESFASANHQSSGIIHPLYSSRGPSDFGWTPYCKPNIAAPGTNICSSVPTNSYSCGYTGTSMASPHSAGTVALLWQACPALLGQMDLTFQTLQNNAATAPADPLCSGWTGCGDVGCNCTYGYGYLDAHAAVQSCASEPKMFVRAINMRIIEPQPGTFVIQGFVRILDETMTPVGGATVDVSWQPPVGPPRPRTATTMPNGVARFNLRAMPTGTYTLCVDDVTAAGYVYDPGMNWETCDSIVYP